MLVPLSATAWNIILLFLITCNTLRSELRDAFSSNFHVIFFILFERFLPCQWFPLSIRLLHSLKSRYVSREKLELTENSWKDLSTGFFFLLFVWLLSVRPYFCHTSSLWICQRNSLDILSLSQTHQLTILITSSLGWHSIASVSWQNISSNLTESWLFSGYFVIA